MTTQKSAVAVVKGPDRYQNIVQALNLLGKEAFSGTKHLIKPNFVSTKVHLSATHPDAARAVVDFIRQHTGRAVVIAEGAATSDTFKGYEYFGFLDLAKTYEDVELADLNRDAYETVTLYDQDFKPQSFRIAEKVLKSDHRISLAIPKTHDAVMATLSLKNMVVGSLIRDMGCNLVNLVGDASDRLLGLIPSCMKQFFSFQGLSRLGITRISGSDKVKLHQGYLNLHLFIYQLARIIPPHLCVLDGFSAMEGNGPVSGDRVDWGIAIAGADAVAVDTVAAHLMGFDPRLIGYLYFCSKDGLGEGDINKINIIGAPLAACTREFKPHESYQVQLSWKEMGEAVFERLQERLHSGNCDQVRR
jgi:uncharacterized protein (DUF362 family)